MNRSYTIGELAELAGVSTKTLRVYERKGLLLPSRNEGNQYRMYTEDAVRKLEQIQLMKYLGFSLDQIEDCHILRFDTSLSIHHKDTHIRVLDSAD